jgi:hypothetical protein
VEVYRMHQNGALLKRHCTELVRLVKHPDQDHTQ